MSGSARGLDFMARHGIKGIVSATAEELVERWFRDYQEAARRHGRELALGEDLILGFRMSIDDTVEGAIRAARPYFEEHAKVMAPLGMLRYSEEHVKAVVARQAQSPTAATLENGVRNRAWLCGPSGDIVAYLKEIEQRYPGLDHVMIAWAIGTPRDLMIEQLIVERPVEDTSDDHVMKGLARYGMIFRVGGPKHGRASHQAERESAETNVGGMAHGGDACVLLRRLGRLIPGSSARRHMGYARFIVGCRSYHLGPVAERAGLGRAHAGPPYRRPEPVRPRYAVPGPGDSQRRLALPLERPCGRVRATVGRHVRRGRSDSSDRIRCQGSGALQNRRHISLSASAYAALAKTHSDFTLPYAPRAESKVFQGVTTEVLGHCGFSVAPVSPGRAPTLQEYLAGFAPWIETRETGMAEYMDHFPAVAVNTIMQVGHNTLRLMTVGMDNRAPTHAEMTEMRRLLDEGLAAGALGLSSGLFTAPGSFAHPDELLDLLGVVRRHGGTYATHSATRRPRSSRRSARRLPLPRNRASTSRSST